jgi:uncharacterized protein (TIGR02246 family)
MTATHPEQLANMFAQAFNNRDLDGLMSLFTEDAVFVPQPGKVVTGDGIRPALEAFLALNGPIDLTVKRTIITGNIAQIIADWRVEGVDSTGAPLVVSGTTADVALRAPDGTWRYLIDNPFGTV